MKVPTSLRSIYFDIIDDYHRLKEYVDKRILSIKDPRWHYESRVKELVSYAQKIETGRFSNPREIEDLFACTIVVENMDKIPYAEELIKQKFKFEDKRPRNIHRDSAPPDSFRFEDLRLYIRWIDALGSKPTGLEGKLFEVQIKTFLQHAWGIATHDLTYKSEEKSWSKQRIAFQIKAMLENAEVAIKEAESISKSTALNRSDGRTADIKEVLGLLLELWPVDQLPNNKKLLAKTVFEVIKAMGLTVTQLREAIEEENRQGRGLRIQALSPYGVIIQALSNQRTEKFQNFITSSKQKHRILLYQEIKLPGPLERETLRNAIVV